MIDTFLLGDTYNAESKEIRDTIKSLDTPAPMLASSLLWTNVITRERAWQ